MNDNTSLTELDLGSDNNMRNEVRWKNWKEHPKRRMKMNKWTENRIGCEGAKRIGELIKINSSLTQLNLCCDEKSKMMGVI